ncbi:MAG TPA: hypothetical protein VHQ03_02900, partial [Candidatus Dormibacteraeota bacterium]|nr:hypothetical protein [Candidatus Dormibacteraeota bacterium]
MIELGGVAPAPRWSFRLVAAAVAAVTVLGVTAVKLAELQVSDGPRLAAMAEANTIHRVILEADRGVIYDRHGAPLVQNSPVWSLAVTPAALPVRASDQAAELITLSRMTGVAEEEIADRIFTADPYSPVTIATQLTQPQELALDERMPQLPG